MTREEAIKVVKERLNYYESEKRLRAACELLIPELRESDDERIRKELISYCKDLVRMNQDDKVMLSIYEPWLVWLEKQKVDINKLRRDLYQSGYNDGYQHGKEDAQKEQKLVEFPLKDKVFSIMKKLNSLNFMLKLGSNEERLVNEITSEVRDLADYSIDKPAEWSKEDEMYLSQAIETLEHENYSILADKLKSLRTQPHWKPGARWQPCDEHFRALGYAIEYFKKKKNDTTNLEDLYNGLKTILAYEIH